LIVGFGVFGLVNPDTPLDAISLSSVDISIVDMILCAAAAFAAGAIAYFAAYPYGKQLGPLAAAVGLAVWTFRSGTMASLMQVNTTVELRQKIYAQNQLECVLWLAVLAAGLLGSYVAGKLSGLKETPTPDILNPKKGKNQAINIAISMVLTVVITQLAITIFAQDVRLFDSELTYVIGQPGNGQIAFAVILSFAIAAFVAKSYLSVNYVYTTISAVLLMIWTVQAHANSQNLEHMTSFWPANIFPKATCAILPIQLISFAAIGSIAGHWFAIQWAYSRKDAVETATAVILPKKPEVF
jgi:hypothetical protein